MIALLGDSIQVQEVEEPALERETVSAERTDTVVHHRFSAYRIAQQMKGCTPSQIDSVIQKYMPKRVIHYSTRPDTLNIPGMVGHKPYEVSELEKAYEQGFFQKNELLHPELKVSGPGRIAEPLPYMLWRDDYVASALLVCFMILVYVVNRTRKQLKLQAKNFFFSPRENNGLFAEKTTIETHASIFMIIQLSLLGGLMSFAFAQYTLNLFLSQVSPYLLLGIYAGCFLVYFTLKRVLYGFVHWVFFEKTQQKQWRESYDFLISVESILFFPLALIFVYFNISIIQIVWIFGILLIIFKILLMYKCYTIFFNKFYCFFHLFAYLCALELMPMVALVRVLITITDNLIIKF